MVGKRIYLGNTLEMPSIQLYQLLLLVEITHHSPALTFKADSFTRLNHRLQHMVYIQILIKSPNTVKWM